MNYLTKEDREMLIETLACRIADSELKSIFDQLSDKEAYLFLRRYISTEVYGNYPSILKQVIVRTRYKILKSSSTWTSR